MHLHTAAAVVVLSIASAAAAAAQSKPEAAAARAVMKPGLWEVANAIETSGSPMKRTVTSRVCYSAEDVKSVSLVIPQQREFGMKCETRDVKSAGASVAWKIACTGKDGTLNGTGTMMPAESAYTAQTSLDLKSGGKTSKVAQKISGKWISACK